LYSWRTGRSPKSYRIIPQSINWFSLRSLQHTNEK
jgi:hypothetical protein